MERVLDDSPTSLEVSKFPKRSHAELDDNADDDMSPLTLPMSLDHLSDAEKEVFDDKITAFFGIWMEDTVRMFAKSPHNLESRMFWADSIRMELDIQLWRNEFLGRDATEEELDWIVARVMRFIWPEINRILEGQSAGKRIKSNMKSLDANLRSLAGNRPQDRLKFSKIRRAFSFGNMHIGMSSSDTKIRRSDKAEKEAVEVAIDRSIGNVEEDSLDRLSNWLISNGYVTVASR